MTAPEKYRETTWHYGRGLQMSLMREELGLTKEEWADTLRVSRRVVQRWEADQDPIPVGIWEKVEKQVTAFINQAKILACDAGDNARGFEGSGMQRFYHVPTGTMQERKLAALAQDLLTENGADVFLVSEAGWDALNEDGFALHRDENATAR